MWTLNAYEDEKKAKSSERNHPTVRAHEIPIYIYQKLSFSFKLHQSPVLWQ